MMLLAQSHASENNPIINLNIELKRQKLNQTDARNETYSFLKDKNCKKMNLIYTIL